MPRKITIDYKNMTRSERNAYARKMQARYRKKEPKPRTGNRICSFCAVSYPETNEFYYQKRNYFSAQCIPCMKKLAVRNHRKRKYWLSDAEYDTLFNGDGCHICGGHQRLSVDHCHEKHHTRGLLCMPCNTMIGFAKDSPERLRAAAAYLEDRR